MSGPDIAVVPGSPCVLGIAAWSGSGKTTLLKALLPLLRARGLAVAVVKHAHHEFDIDLPGKDSYELRKAGANTVLVGSRKRWALVVETDLPEEPELPDLLRHLPKDGLDLVLVEGLKREGLPKIEVHRPALGQPLLFPEDRHIIAVASDAVVPLPAALPLLDLNAPQQIVEFIVSRFGLGGRDRTEAAMPGAIAPKAGSGG
jgi:molybdopterin-guanine dinucleotide biosynthesis protein MobB